MSSSTSSVDSDIEENLECEEETIEAIEQDDHVASIRGASPQKSARNEGVSSELGKRTAPRSSNTPLARYTLARERDLVTNSFLRR